MSLRQRHDSPSSPPSAVRKVAPARTGPSLSPQRVEGRRAASRLVTAAAAVCPLRRVAVAWGISARSGRVDDLGDEHHPAAITLGDILAAPRAFARPLLVGALSLVNEQEPTGAPLPPELRALRLAGLTGEIAGKIAQARADGVIDDREQADLLRGLHALDRETGAAIGDIARGGR